MRELSELVDLIERDPQLNVVVFDSANPDFFLAHYDGGSKEDRRVCRRDPLACPHGLIS
jgi:enoyl-CoA hydratase/carnithine racemase